jgi:hypothetical protein
MGVPLETVTLDNSRALFGNTRTLAQTGDAPGS